jgi:hypothetical protein
MNDRFPREKAEFLDRDREAGLSRDAPPERLAQSGAEGKQRLVFFLLGRKASRAVFSHAPQTGDVMYQRSLKYVDQVRADFRKRKVSVEIEVHEFNSFGELIAKRPKKRGSKWSATMLLTHGTVLVTNPGAGAAFFKRSGIWLGDQEYFATHVNPDNVIFQAIAEANPKTMDGFRASFRIEAETQLIVCGLGQTQEEVAEFMRDLFGTDGAVAIPKIPVDLDPKTGKLGAISEDNETKIRPLTADDWVLIPKR